MSDLTDELLNLNSNVEDSNNTESNTDINVINFNVAKLKEVFDIVKTIKAINYNNKIENKPKLQYTTNPDHKNKDSYDFLIEYYKSLSNGKLKDDPNFVDNNYIILSVEGDSNSHLKIFLKLKHILHNNSNMLEIENDNLSNIFFNDNSPINQILQKIRVTILNDFRIDIIVLNSLHLDKHNKLIVSLPISPFIPTYYDRDVSNDSTLPIPLIQIVITKNNKYYKNSKIKDLLNSESSFKLGALLLLTKLNNTLLDYYKY